MDGPDNLHPAFSHGPEGLCAEAVPLARIAAQAGTPVFVYSSAALVSNYQALADALAPLSNPAPLICYALKANSNQAVIATLAAAGAGADVVSIGELKRALEAGVAPDRIVFAGVGKTREEMAYALTAGILQLNVESEAELEALNEVAGSVGRMAPTALRINPDVTSATHDKIATGGKQHKFGIDIDQAVRIAARARDLPNILLRGLAVHIGSQLTDLKPYRDAFMRLADLTRTLRSGGVEIDHLDLGGGIGISYDNETTIDLDHYASIVRETVGDLGCALTFEPGRSVVGDAGVLVTRIIYVKPAVGRRFVVVDAAMNDLIRPTLYEAHHHIVPVAATNDGPDGVGDGDLPADIVGPICETGDYLARGRDLPSVKEGDLLAVCGAGAYGAVMGSNYNSRPLAPEVLVQHDRWDVVRRRIEIETVIGYDKIPDWLRARDVGRGAA